MSMKKRAEKGSSDSEPHSKEDKTGWCDTMGGGVPFRHGGKAFLRK